MILKMSTSHQKLHNLYLPNSAVNRNYIVCNEDLAKKQARTTLLLGEAPNVLQQ